MDIILVVIVMWNVLGIKIRLVHNVPAIGRLCVCVCACMCVYVCASVMCHFSADDF